MTSAGTAGAHGISTLAPPVRTTTVTRIGCDDGLNEAILALGQAHVRAVQAFGFSQLVETHVHKRHVGARGEGNGLGDEIVARTAVTLIPPRVSREDEAVCCLSPGFEQLTRRFDARGVDL